MKKVLHSTPIKSGSTAFARGVVYLVGAAALAVCLILIPELIREESVGKSVNHILTFSLLMGTYIIATPFFVALHQTHKLLGYIDQNKTFSTDSIKALQSIKMCAMVFSMLIVIAVICGISMVRVADPREDVTFMITLGLIFTFVPSVIAVFVAVLQKLLSEAVSMKSENDLIV